MDLIERTIEPAVEFFRAMRKREKVSILYGHDCDAVSSAAVLGSIVKDLVGSSPAFVSSEFNYEASKDTIGTLGKFDSVIIPDIPVVPQDFVAKLGDVKVLVIDHHPVAELSGVTYANPRLHDKEAYIPVSYLAYRIRKTVLGDEKMSWVAAVGTLGDHAVTNCLDLFKSLKASDRSLIGDAKLIDEDLYRKSQLGKITKMVNSAEVVYGRKGAEHSLKVLYSAKSPGDAAKDRKLAAWGRRFDEEFGKASRDFRKSHRAIGNMIVYEVKSDLKLQSSLSGYLTQFHPGKILVLYQKVDRGYNISLRRGAGVKQDLGDMAKVSASKIEGAKGGGHPAAAGARVPADKIEEFIEGLRSA